MRGKSLLYPEIKKALIISWGILTIFLSNILWIPFILPYSWLNQWIPRCSFKVATGQDCFFCGMTRAFYELSMGQFSVAHQLNTLAIPLSCILLLNLFICLYYLCNQLLFKPKP